MKNIKFIVLGVIFGIILMKSEVVSWFRIQEMFRFQSFHMYGIIGTAILTGMISIFLIKKFHIKAANGEPIVIKPKKMHKGVFVGGVIFGLGWALTGACPGPLYSLVGGGYLIIGVVLFSAIAG